MIVKVTSREKLFIIIGIAAMGAVAIFYAASTLMPDGEDLSQKVDLKKRMLRSQRETLSREDTYKTRVEQYKKQLEQDMTRLLPGDNASLAAAELQKIIRDFADQSGVEITQRNVLPEKKVQDILTRVSIRVDTNCNPEQLVNFLASIENHEKLLKVDEMNISSIRIARRFEIRPSLTISGYITAKEEKPAEKPATRPAAKV